MVVRSLAMTLPGGTRLGDHDHDWPQLVYATEGIASVEADAGAWVVPPQRAVWVPPQATHAIESVGTLALRTLYLHPKLPGSTATSFNVIHVAPLLRELIVEVVRLGHLDQRAPTQVRLARVLADQLDVASHVPADLALPRDARARIVANKVRKNPGGRQTLAELAAGSGAAARTVERIFQREVAMTFGQWRQHARLVHSLCLLGQGTPVTEVAVQSGYESTSAFIAMFKRSMGTTPGQYFSSVDGGAS